MILLSRETLQEFRPPSFKCTPHGNHLYVFTLKVNCISRHLHKIYSFAQKKPTHLYFVHQLNYLTCGSEATVQKQQPKKRTCSEGNNLYLKNYNLCNNCILQRQKGMEHLYSISRARHSTIKALDLLMEFDCLVKGLFLFELSGCHTNISASQFS